VIANSLFITGCWKTIWTWIEETGGSSTEGRATEKSWKVPTHGIPERGVGGRGPAGRARVGALLYASHDRLAPLESALKTQNGRSEQGVDDTHAGVNGRPG
jgi:hypothetical protein